MFRIYDKSMSDEEILELNKLWVGMCERLWSDCGCLNGSDCVCLNGSDCKYKRLCRSICDSCQRIEKVLKERNLISD